MYSCHLFLISSASIRCIHFLSFIVPILHEIFPWYLWFSWRDSESFPFYCFFSLIMTEEGFLISPCYSLELCIQKGISILFSFVFSFSSFLSYLSGLLRQPFCLFACLFWGMVLITVSCTMSWTSIHSSGTLSIRFNPLNQSICHFHYIIISEFDQLCLTLCDPMDCSLPGSSIHGIFQASVLKWAAISFSKGSSQSREWTLVSGLADALPSETPGKRKGFDLGHTWMV